MTKVFYEKYYLPMFCWLNAGGDPFREVVAAVNWPSTGDYYLVNKVGDIVHC